MTAQTTYPQQQANGGRASAAVRGIIIPILTLALLAVPIYIILLFADMVPLIGYQPTTSPAIQVYRYAEPGNAESELLPVRTYASAESPFETEADKAELVHAFLVENYGEDVPQCEQYQQAQGGWFGRGDLTWTCK